MKPDAISNATVPTQSPSSTSTGIEPTLPAYAVMLRDAIIKLEKAAHPTAVPALENYLWAVSPDFANRGDSHFPHAVRPHRHDPERCGDQRTYAVLYFTIGNAILSYYDALRGAEQAVTPILKSRVERLQQIATEGLARFLVTGSISHGFHFVKRA